MLGALTGVRADTQANGERISCVCRRRSTVIRLSRDDEVFETVLNQHPLDLVEGDVIAVAAIELRREG